MFTDSVAAISRTEGHDGTSASRTGCAVLRVLARSAHSGGSSAAVDRSVCRPVDLRRELAPFYSSMGRPSIDPELMIRMLIIGYCFGIRSERRLCEEVHLNLAYRWFCRLGLDGEVPDHSTFSKNRHGRFRESDLLRRVFETVLRRCIREGLVGGEAFAVDASLIKADANRQKGIEGEKGLPPEADRPGGRRISGCARRCRLRRCDRGHAQVRLAGRSGGALDRCPWRASLLRLLDQLSDRRRQRDHRRCRGNHRDPAGRGPGRQTHDRALDVTASISARPSSSATAPMVRPRCSAGWLTSRASSRM